VRHICSLGVTLGVTCMLVSSVPVQAGGAKAAQFVKKPTATTDGDQVRIDFAVSRATDVTVTVEDAQERVVRHVAAGMLGPDAPAPLKPNSLEQSLVWDGKDDAGSPVVSMQNPRSKTQNRVRVALGLGAAFDRVLISDPYTLSQATGLAVGPDGTAYVVIRCGGTGPTWNGQQMVAFNRDGTYQRMVMPFPADLPMERVQGFDVIELEGRPAPLIHDVEGRSFYGGGLGPRKGGMTVTQAGVILRLIGGVGSSRQNEPISIGALDGRGAACWGRYAGPPLLTARSTRYADRSAIAASSDGQWAYVAGVVTGGKAGLPAVHRVRLPGRGPAEAFFGDPAQVGKDESHLGGPPRGLAVDGRGHLLIADSANNRIVVVQEKDGAFVRAFSPEAPPAANPDKAPETGLPDTLAVHPTTGAIYLTRLTGKGTVELVKLASLDKPTVLARLPFPNAGNPDFPWLMALDAGAERPLVWMAGDDGRLLRIEDQGDRFGTPRQISRSTIGNAAFLDLSVDHVRQEVYVRGQLGPYWWFRYNESKDELGKVQPAPYPSAAGSQLVVAPDGTLYSPAYPSHILKFDYSGKPLAWERQPPVPEKLINPHTKMPHNIYSPVSMTYSTHTLGVRYDGHLFAFEPDAPAGRPPKMLIEYLPSGERRPTPVIWKVSDTAVGPKFDRQGNIYVAEQVKRPEWLYPPEFASVVGEVKPGSLVQPGVKDSILMVYGSILKFSPKGGMVNFPAKPRGNTSQTRMDPTGANPFDGEPKLDPSLHTQDAMYYRQYRLYPVTVTGAEWIHTGVSQVGFVPCNCENIRFDVDDFGRVWYPDLGRFRVVVLDTNGNEITHFGRYGNADDGVVASPNTPNPSPAARGGETGHLAFAWLVGVGATDRYVYTADSLARRVLRAKLTYAAEETCALP
jgi:hypothetical protein